jgi:hypothetical protein
MMNKLCTIYLSVLMLLCIVTAAHATLVNVSSQDPSPASGGPLKAGVEYLFTVSGLYSYDFSNYADAEFSRYQGVWGESYYGIHSPTDTLDLVISGNFVDWLGSADGVNYTPHTYSPDTVYRYYYTGTGWPVSFYIYDASRYDNAGGLTVRIEEVPEPSSLAAVLGGCAGLLAAGLRKRTKKG